MSKKKLIANGWVIDCTGAGPKANTSIWLDGPTIGKIGPHEEVQAFASQQGPYEVIDASHLTVMPGLIDVHVHISYGDILSSEDLQIATSAEYRTLRAALAVRKVLRAGVTAICDPGTTWGVSVAIRDAIEAGLIEGPRMTAGSQYISTWNGIGSPFPTWVQHPPSAFSVMCNTRDEMIEQVRRQIKNRVDVIKIAGDGDTADPSAQYGSFTSEDLRAIAEMTHLLGKRCTIHARGGRTAVEACRAGFDWIIHASFLKERDLEEFVKRDTPINPTLSLLANTIEWGPDMGIAPNDLDAYRRELDVAGRILEKAHKAGIRLMAGTDSGQSAVPYGEWHARELEHLMHYCGMSAMEALLTGTKHAAFALKMTDRIGTLEVGKLADILLVDGDPLEDISVLQQKDRLKAIILNGDVVDTKTPLPDPKEHYWEHGWRAWERGVCTTQDVVRQFARSKPKWMQQSPSKAVAQ